MKQPRPHSTTRGFSRAVTLMQKRIRGATETRGFAQSRVLTHWAEIVGESTAKIAHPVDVKEQLREKVNACYGYNAIARIRITQTAATGFAEGQMAFDHGPKAKRGPQPAAQAAAQDLAAPVENEDLRLALAALGANVISKRPSDT